MVIVRNQNLSPDRLAYGGNKVLVAGYSKYMKEINFNLSDSKIGEETNRFFIYSDNKLLYFPDYETNEVCVDYSLLLGLVISWVLIQIIFAIVCIIMVRKYKKYYQEEYVRQAYEEYNKNFDIGASNLDTRRVRWADSGDEMQ